jgi:catechol 2,3-dioxygenase-like lactoylglutathione lyase family enzyme
MRLNHVALVCSSEQGTNDFYRGVLGLRRIKSSILSKDLAGQIFGIDREYRIVVYGNDQFTAEIFLTDHPPGPSTGLEHVCLEVKDREGFVRKCEALHVEVNRIPKGDTLLTFVKDYDGNLFEIKESSA